MPAWTRRYVDSHRDLVARGRARQRRACSWSRTPRTRSTEYDETDNRAFRPFSVLGLPDLVLAAGDVALVPALPARGPAGDDPRAACATWAGSPPARRSLRAYEGEPGTGTAIGDAPSPRSPPGEQCVLELAWTPAAAAGRASAHAWSPTPDDQVREQDEGNNAGRRSVVVQDADLYLTEPYFSPDGDGVKDDTCPGLSCDRRGETSSSPTAWASPCGRSPRARRPRAPSCGTAATTAAA